MIHIINHLPSSLQNTTNSNQSIILYDMTYLYILYTFKNLFRFSDIKNDESKICDEWFVNDHYILCELNRNVRFMLHWRLFFNISVI